MAWFIVTRLKKRPIHLTTVISHHNRRHNFISTSSLTFAKSLVMKKIAAVFDGLRFSDSTLQYAITASKLSPAHLEGLFPDDFTYNSFNIYQQLRDGATKKQLSALEAQDRKKRDNAAHLFEQACQQAGLTYSVHRDRNIAIQDVLHESIYADLLVINSHETFMHDAAKPPTRFIRDLLTDVQCPVLLAPPVFKEIEKVVLLYDGEPSSVYAIKMASYLFNGFGGLPVEVVSIKQTGANLHLDDGRLMKEFMKRHAPKASYKVMTGDAEDKIPKWLGQQPPGTLVVLGAYRRGAVSRWFRASMADVLMSELNLPLFIAHNK